MVFLSPRVNLFSLYSCLFRFFSFHYLTFPHIFGRSLESFSPSDSPPETEVSFEMPSKGNKTIDINFEHFCHELWCHCQYDVACIEEWSLKREWADFSKLFLSTLRPTSRSVKGLYDYFRRNKSDILTHINSLSGGKNVQVERKDEENGQVSTVYFPNLTSIQNSVVLVNSSSASISSIPCQGEKGKEIIVLGNSLEFDKVISSAQNIQESTSTPKASLTPDFDSSETMEVGNNISASFCQKEVPKTPLFFLKPSLKVKAGATHTILIIAIIHYQI